MKLVKYVPYTGSRLLKFISHFQSVLKFIYFVIKSITSYILEEIGLGFPTPHTPTASASTVRFRIDGNI